MSAASESRVEAAKLARLLRLEGPDALPDTERVPAAELRAYREAVTELLYDDDHATLLRAADAAHLLPGHVLAAIGERALGPLLCARLTGLLEAHRATEISEHFSVEFLARLAAELDPRRAVGVVTSLPTERVPEIAAAMAARGEHVAMGRFVAHLQEATLAACLERLGDEDLLQISYVLEGKERLPAIFELLGVERARRVFELAGEQGLEEEALEVIGHLDAKQRRLLKQQRPLRKPKTRETARAKPPVRRPEE